MSGRFSDDTLQQIKDRISIVEVVRASVPSMKKKGRDWWACCPFHHEKSPSFHVRDQEGYYHCFGCGAHGDVFTFVKETRGGEFSDAVEHLAAMAGVKLEKKQVDPVAEKRRQDGYALLEAAGTFFHKALRASPAVDYLKKRGLTGEDAKFFGLGWAEDSWDTLHSTMVNEGFAPKLLEETGLAIPSNKGGYDRFRGRVMFPIYDLKDRVIGFGGRVIGEGEPKYLNSPETPFFNKSRTLYNLNKARSFIKQEDAALVVEGYMDVIGLWHHGIKTAVAPLGTSITAEQVQLLWRFHACPTVCLDGDAAGRQAAARLAQRVLAVLKPGYSLRFVWLPEGEDPDSFVASRGAESFYELLKQTSGLEDVLWQEVSHEQNLRSGEGRAAVEEAIGRLVAQIKDETMRRHLKGGLKDRMWQKITGGFGAKIKQQSLPGVKVAPLERQLLALTCKHPEVLDRFAEKFFNIRFENQSDKQVRDILGRFLSEKPLAQKQFHDYVQNSNTSTLIDKLITTTLVGISNPEALEPEALWLRLYHDIEEKQTRMQNRLHKRRYGEV